ncbi:hypothetical protein [Dasania marina]|uniref:hypothetical protein n=1 Tax=Dasania marina TaxID=471499 RepID=UPI000369133B|nr:hypothetical protein [Dasania marina]
MREFLRGWLGINEMESRVNELTGRVDALVDVVDSQSKSLGNYNNRTRDELLQMKGVVESLLNQFEELGKHAELDRDEIKVKSTLRKLRYNKTKINNALNIVRS